MRIKYLQLALPAFLLITGCAVTPEEAGERYKNEKILVSGINFSKKNLNDFFAETGQNGLTREQFLSAISVRRDSAVTIEEIDVIVDMSAGMNVGIEKSYDAMKAVMNRLVPGTAKYFHADDDPTSLQPITQIKTLADAAYLTNKVNFAHANSMLRPAFESASAHPDRISLVITDFLLDEGTKGDRRLKNGRYIKETADNSTWAKDYFSKWFAGKNRILIYPFRYNAVNYYGKQETKYIYYILFIPKGARNSNLDGLINDFGKFFPTSINLDPADISLSINSEELPGSCISDGEYNQIKGKGNKPQVFDEFATQHIPFSFNGLKDNKYTGKPVICNMTLQNGSPFKASLSVNSFDLSKAYYKALATASEGWSGKVSYDEGKPLDDLVWSAPDSAGSSTPITFSFGDGVAKENFMATYKTFAKLLYTRISVGTITLNDLDESLLWDFQTREGTMENAALRESLHLALDEFAVANKDFQVGTLLVSIHDK